MKGYKYEKVVLGALLCLPWTVGAAEVQPYKEIMEYIKKVPQSISLYNKLSQKTIDDWADTATRVGRFIKAKEPSLYAQYIKDQNKISQLFTTISAIYTQVITPESSYTNLMDEEVNLGAFKTEYDYKKLDKIIAPLRTAQKALDQGGARFAIWKNKEARQILDAFKKALKAAFSSVIAQADQIIKEKGLIVR